MKTRAREVLTEVWKERMTYGGVQEKKKKKTSESEKKKIKFSYKWTDRQEEMQMIPCIENYINLLSSTRHRHKHKYKTPALFGQIPYILDAYLHLGYYFDRGAMHRATSE